MRTILEHKELLEGIAEEAKREDNYITLMFPSGVVVLFMPQDIFEKMSEESPSFQKYFLNR